MGLAGRNSQLPILAEILTSSMAFSKALGLHFLIGKIGTIHVLLIDEFWRMCKEL